jgi:hypothetical protein
MFSLFTIHPASKSNIRSVNMVRLTVVTEILKVMHRLTLKTKKIHVPSEAESNLQNFMGFVG